LALALTAVGVAAAVAVVAGAALASIPSSTGVIHACYSATGANKQGGTPLNIFNPSKGSCGSGQTPLTWETPQSHVFFGSVHNIGGSASFDIGGKGMLVSEVSTGVTKITIPNAKSRPVLTVSAVANDATQHCEVGAGLNSRTWEVECFDQGQPWPTDYHVIAAAS
jgi:hypothetical protein